MSEAVREETKYITCADASMSGNYSLFFYEDGYMTAYNEDAKIEHYFTITHFETKFLKSNVQ
jgi:hypothetical protein